MATWVLGGGGGGGGICYRYNGIEQCVPSYTVVGKNERTWTKLSPIVKGRVRLQLTL